jgi:hypothetical protein
MATLQYNITSVAPAELLKRGDNVSNAKTITLANVHASASADVDLFIYDVANNKSFHILKNVGIPHGTTLVLGSEDGISFNNSARGFSMRIQVDAGDGSTAVPVDVIIKQ